MKNMKYKIIIIFTILLFEILLINSIVNAASMGMSINKSSCNIGDTFTVTISGVNGKVSVSGSSNISLNKSGTIWIDGKETITGTAKSVGKGTITVTPIDASTTAAEPEEITSSASRSIEIKEKQTTQATPTTPTTPTTTTKKPTTVAKPTTTPQTKQEEPKKEVVEDNFYINSVVLKGIKENGETEDIILSPEFNKDTYEYTCNVSAQITKIEIQKEAGQYTNSIIVTGGEELKIGENIITLMLSAEDHQAKTYTIKVIKEEAVETSANIAEEKIEEDIEQKEPAMIHMPVWAFIALQMGIIVVEVITILFIIKQTKARH